MYLVLRASLEAVTSATLDPEGSIVSYTSWENSEWDSLTARRLKEIMQRELKVQGRVFHGIGYVLPFGNGTDEQPRLADLSFIKSLAAQSTLHDAIMKPSRLVVEAGQLLWPHLPHYLLFDTHLSAELPKHVIMPGLSYDASRHFDITPHVIHSYGHRANQLMTKDGQKFISLYIDRAVSVALFDGHILKDALVSYSPLSPLGGFGYLSAIDAGTSWIFNEKIKTSERTNFLLKETGLAKQLDHSFDFEESLQIAGLVPRHDLGFMDKLEIERIEWTELSLKCFVRSLRHALASMLATDDSVKVLVVNTSAIPQKSGLWPLLAEGSLHQLKIVFSDTLDLQPAGADLIAVHTA